MKRARHAERGLSLVEVLIALAIAAMLMAPLAALFDGAADSAVSGKAALELDADARFAVERIAARAAAAEFPSLPPEGADVPDPSTWLAPFSYKQDGADLVETEGKGKEARSGTVATRVEQFKLTAPDFATGQPLVKIELTLAAEGSRASVTRTVRLGGRQ